jgi:hypothetical protein
VSSSAISSKGEEGGPAINEPKTIAMETLS